MDQQSFREELVQIASSAPVQVIEHVVVWLTEKLLVVSSHDPEVREIVRAIGVLKDAKPQAKDVWGEVSPTSAKSLAFYDFLRGFSPEKQTGPLH